MLLDPTSPERAKPIVAMMGEFSAGKSTLANLLLGETVSPVKVTATQLPPIWYTHGRGLPTRVDLDGTATQIRPHEISDVDPEDTAYVKVPLAAGVLELMDLIDMPGISDPNMPSKVWKRLIHEADSVLWCSHATQAWRQSEAATWAELPPSLHAHSLLLLTRADKLSGQGDIDRVVARVEKEAQGLFSGIFPISLVRAAQAGEDRDAWEQSGAEAVTRTLLDIVFKLDAATRRRPQMIVASCRRHVSRALSGNPVPGSEPAAPGHPIRPRRVTPRRSGGSRDRLPQSALHHMVPGT